jgi:hypothetical protein
LEVAEGTDSARILKLPGTRPSPYRKREIIHGANDAKTYARPMPANARRSWPKVFATRIAGWTNFSEESPGASEGLDGGGLPGVQACSVLLRGLVGGM